MKRYAKGVNNGWIDDDRIFMGVVEDVITSTARNYGADILQAVVDFCNGDLNAALCSIGGSTVYENRHEAVDEYLDSFDVAAHIRQHVNHETLWSVISDLADPCYIEMKDGRVIQLYLDA